MTEPPARGLVSRALSFVVRAVTRLGFRLIAVNVVVVCVPLFGIEFARLFERRLLDALERDMDHQAMIVGELVRLDTTRGLPLGAPEHEAILVRVARATRARIRLLDPLGNVVVDSHAHGPPEGREPGATDRRSSSGLRVPSLDERWDAIPDRVEVREARAGFGRSAFTRVRDQAPGVFLFLARSVRVEGRVIAVVYVNRSTTPVMQDLHRIRRSLSWLLGATLAITIGVTLLLALSITRPVAALAKSAQRIANGEKDVAIDRSLHGEIGELADAIATMTERLDERLVHSRDFAADVAHELKSPLTSIRGAAELLEEGAADDPVARARFLGNIRLDVERLDRIVSRLLELGRVEAGSDARTPVDLEAMLREVADRATTPDVLVRLEARLRPIVLVRASDVEAAVTNVIENAVRFAPAGSEVQVTLAADARDVVVTVTDRGPGIPASDQAKVFERFYTTDAAHSGTGLGLPIARSAMIAHGGTIELASVPGSTTFRLKLPASLRVH